MKTKILTLFTVIFLGVQVSYAAFPVERNVIEPQENVDNLDNEEQDLSPLGVLSSGKSQVTALLLCIFLGGIGIHRFYLGYTWQGVVQLLTLGGLGIWALIDLIRIITGDLQPKDGSYDKTL